MKLVNKIVAYSSSLGLLGMGLVANVHAAADADLVSGLASTSAIASDNKATILTFITAIFTVILVIAVAKAGMNWALAKIAGAFGRRKRK